MEQGVMSALVVTFVWVLLQNLLMHICPSRNRFAAMVVGYVLSLPFVYVSYRGWPELSTWLTGGRAESNTMGIFHAYFFHLLLFLFYVECFYHVERSVTFRLLVELLGAGTTGLPLYALQSRYSVDEMVAQRLEALHEKGFLDRQGDVWTLRPKGLILARATTVLSWVFQSKGQHERS